MDDFTKYAYVAILALALLVVVGFTSTPTQEVTCEDIDDSVITTEVKLAIFNEPSLKSVEINDETF